MFPAKHKLWAAAAALAAMFIIVGTTRGAVVAPSPTRTVDQAFAHAFQNSWNRAQPTAPVTKILCMRMKNVPGRWKVYEDCILDQHVNNKTVCGELFISTAGKIYSGSPRPCTLVNKLIYQYTYLTS